MPFAKSKGHAPFAPQLMPNVRRHREAVVSLDFVVWVACPVALPEDLPQPEDWVGQSPPSLIGAARNEDDEPTSWIYEGGEWLLRMSHSEDKVPLEVSSLIDGELHGLSLIVEGNGQSAEEASFAVISAIAERCSEMVIESPAGIFKFPPEAD